MADQVAQKRRGRPRKKIEWPADRVERKQVAELVPYARNARTHSEAQVAQIAASIREWGWTVPVLVDEANTIIAGHGRILAAEKLGLDTVPVMVAEGWTDAQRQAYVIADNQLALNASWDTEFLRIELQELQDLGFDIGLTGFDDGMFAALLDDLPETDPEKEWEGMPEYTGLEPCYRKIVINFDDQDAVDSFAALLGQDIGEKTKSLWFPYKEKRDLEALRWDDGEDVDEEAA